MTMKQYAPGEKSSSGYVIREVLGDCSAACVFTTEDNQLGWEYKDNKGKPIEEHGEIIAYFNALMARIGLLDLSAKQKKSTYIFLGKSLFSGLSDSVSVSPAKLFSDVENQINKFESTEGIGQQKLISEVSKITPGWLISNLTLGAWGALVSGIVGAFIAGVTLGNTSFVKELRGIKTVDLAALQEKLKESDQKVKNFEKVQGDLKNRYKYSGEWVTAVTSRNCPDLCSSKGLKPVNAGQDPTTSTNIYVCRAGGQNVRPGFNYAAHVQTKNKCTIELSKKASYEGEFECLCLIESLRE